MTLDDALLVQEKDILASPFTSPAYAPFKVKAVWISKDRRFVRFQLVGYKPAGAWVPHDRMVRVPEGWRWSTTHGWVTQSGASGTLRLELDPELAEDA